jgi:hypothetical protein
MLFGSFHTGSSASAYFKEARRFWFLEPHPWTWEHDLFGAQMVQAVQHGFPNIPGGHGSAWVIDGLATCMVLVFLCLVWSTALSFSYSQGASLISLFKQIYSGKIAVTK